MFFLKNHTRRLIACFAVLVIGILLNRWFLLSTNAPSIKVDLIETHITTGEILSENSLISNYTVSSPAPLITILSGRNSGNGFVSKSFHSGAIQNSECNNANNIFCNSKTQSFFQIVQLHLAFCVFRI